jgi:hypothetical protein
MLSYPNISPDQIKGAIQKIQQAGGTVTALAPDQYSIKVAMVDATASYLPQLETLQVECGWIWKGIVDGAIKRALGR